MNKKRFVFITISWLLVAVSMLLILKFSFENKETSSETSKGVIENVLNIFMDENEITEEVINKFQFPVRKIGHFSVYMLLGFCLANAFVQTVKLKKYYLYIFSVCTSFCYGMIDEFLYQNLSNGRAPSFIDVLIDTSGSIFGVFLYMLLVLCTKKILKREVGI
ncbi:MAG: VanZ family protein [Clostridia bacterium]|nr:VanZ family protein [Clostridia bacterium]MBQ7788141.1 VanZ family protein [Clostridia bacterium]